MAGEARQILAQNLRFLPSRIPLRLKARGSPSVASPFGGQPFTGWRPQSASPMYVILAQNLRLLRFHRCWSQETLGFEAGLHRTYISQIEKGKSSAAPMLPASAALVRPWTSRLHRQHRETRPRPRPHRLRAPPTVEWQAGPERRRAAQEMPRLKSILCSADYSLPLNGGQSL